MDLCLSPGLCGCTAGTQDRPCPRRRLYTSLGAGQRLGAESGLPLGTSAGSHWKGTQSRYKWASVWCTRRTAGPGFYGEASWFKQKQKEVKCWVFLTKVRETTLLSVTHKFHESCAQYPQYHISTAVGSNEAAS